MTTSLDHHGDTPRHDRKPSVTTLPCTAVLFDCDGVLVDSESTILRSWRRWAEQMGVDPAAVLPDIHGRRSQDTVARFIEPARREKALALIDSIEMDHAPEVTAIPGAANLLDSIPAGRWAIFTSGSRNLARARLAAAGIPIPSVLITGQDVTDGKPHPEGYLAAARGLDAPAEDCVVVEDAPPGIRAARAAEARAVLGIGSLEPGADGPDIAIPDLRFARWSPTGLEILPVAG